MKNFRSLFILVLAVSVLAGCNPLKKMQKNASLINYEVTPGVLETHGGEVAISIKGVFPETIHRSCLLQLERVLPCTSRWHGRQPVVQTI